MQHWSSYWSSTKSLNSFAEGKHKQGYVGEIADYWQSIFKSLHSSANILDIATGNGGLAVLAKEFNSNFSVCGADAANINPISRFTPSDKVFDTLQSIKFYGEMPSEKLRFKDNEFDAIISQFGFEYAQPSTALLEINRVLKPNGKFVALIHHNTSFITADCKIGIDIINKLSVKNGLLDQLKSFVNFCQTIENKDNPTQEQQNQFKNKNKNLLDLFKKLQHDCNNQDQLDWYNLLAKELVPLIINWRHADEQGVDVIIKNSAFFKQRLQDQMKAAWSIDDVNEISTLAKKYWHSFEVSSLNIESGKLCWILQAIR
jgi:ubiquinone/menaquinone biosynthesis C-methylase UbiE